MRALLDTQVKQGKVAVEESQVRQEAGRMQSQGKIKTAGDQYKFLVGTNPEAANRFYKKNRQAVIDTLRA